MVATDDLLALRGRAGQSDLRLGPTSETLEARPALLGMATKENETIRQLRAAVIDMRDGKRGMLSTTELRTTLGVSKMTISRWAREGIVPHFQLNGVLRFNPAEILAWAEQRRL